MSWNKAFGDEYSSREGNDEVDCLGPTIMEHLREYDADNYTDWHQYVTSPNLRPEH